MRIGIYPGSFDPITNGHKDIIKRAISMVDVLIVAVLHNKDKNNMFSVGERVEFIKQTIEACFDDESIRERILVETFDGLLVDFAKKRRANVVIRGIRDAKDFEYESSMARINKDLYKNLETIFLATDREYMDISSSVVREIVSFGGDIKHLTPECVAEYIDDIK